MGTQANDESTKNADESAKAAKVLRTTAKIMTLGTGGSPGVNMRGGLIITFLELADMVDATQEVGVGVGWG